MKSSLRTAPRWNFSWLLGALVTSALLASCSKKEAMPPPPPIVVIMEMKPSEVAISNLLIGQLDSSETVEIRARVEAFVEQIPFTEGTEVKEGDLLFVLDRKPLQEKLAGAQGMLAEAEAAFKKSEADVARLAPLYEKNAIPRQDLENAMAAREVGEAGVKSALARVESAQLDLGYCEVKAPINGLIGASMVSRGELVGKGQATQLATISALDPIWFYANVSEVEYLKALAKSKELNRKLEDLPLKLLLGDGSEHADAGRFVFIDRAVNPKTGTLRIRAEFPNPQKTLRPGMFARVRADMGNRQNCLEIPERAIVNLQGKSFVWIVDEKNLCSLRPISVGEKNASNYLILDGVKAGERVIVEGIQKARDGGTVNAMTPEQLAAAKAARQAQENAPHP
jgi:membrane fusion protein (multidrug efflux system)